MPSDSRFSRLPDGPGEPVTIFFEERPLEARSGDSVAAALLASGQVTTRTTPVSGAGRGPFCMMGACFDCLVEIDGEPNRQGCMTLVRQGLRIRRMAGARAAGPAPLDPEAGDG